MNMEKLAAAKHATAPVENPYRAYSMRRTHYLEGCGVRTLNDQGPKIRCVRTCKCQGPQKSGVVEVISFFSLYQGPQVHFSAVVRSAIPFLLY